MLDAIQSVARIDPFDRWSPSRILHFEEAYWAHPQEEKDTREVQLARFLDRLPPVVRSLCTEDRSVLESSRVRYKSFLHLEPALELFAEVLAAAHTVWPDGPTRQRLIDWSTRAADPQQPGIPDPAIAPGGLSWALTLLASSSLDNNADRLLDLVDQMPLEGLRRVATRPDATHHTLVSHALRLLGDRRNVSSDGGTVFHRSQPVEALVACFRQAVARLGPKEPFFHNTGGALGLVAQQLAESVAENDRNIEALLARQMPFLECAIDLGVPLTDPLHPIDWSFLTEVRSKNPSRMPSLDRLESMIACEALSHNTPCAVPRTTRNSSRLRL